MKNREEFVKWCNDKKITLDLTRTQSLFLDFLLDNQIELSPIGDLDRIFTITRRFIKDETK